MEIIATQSKKLIPVKIFSVLYIFVLTSKYIFKAILADLNQGDQLNNLKQLWALEILNYLNIEIKINGQLPQQGSSHIFIGNHISYIDVPLLLSVAPWISFVSKKEVSNWPIIGMAAKIIDTIFVDRQSQRSRLNVKSQIALQMKLNNRSIVLFPSGTTKMGISASWRKGSFEIAKDNQWKIIPFRISYKPLREHAYIDDDNFLIHLNQLFKVPNKKVTIEFHEPVEVIDVPTDTEKWKQWCEDEKI